MNLVLEHEAPPLYEDEAGAVRVGNSRVLLETVIRAFQDGASPESIVNRQGYLRRVIGNVRLTLLYKT